MINKGLYNYQEEQKFYKKQPFPSQLRMVIIDNFGSEKTKLLFKFVLEQYLDFQKFIFVSPSLSQKEYEVIIKSLQKGLNINQNRTIFDQQKHITNIDIALDIITSNDKFKSSKLEVVQLKHPDIPLPQELNPNGVKQTLIIDDCTIIKSINPTQLYVYERQLNINTIYLSQKYTKVPCTIRENCNVFVLFKQTVKAIKDFIYKEIDDQFENDIVMKNFFHANIKDKHDFVLYNKEKGKWYNRTLSPIFIKNLELINSGMGFRQLYPD